MALCAKKEKNDLDQVTHLPKAYSIKWAITVWAIAQKKQYADKITHSFKSVYAEILVSVSLGLLVWPTD